MGRREFLGEGVSVIMCSTIYFTEQHAITYVEIQGVESIASEHKLVHVKIISWSPCVLGLSPQQTLGQRFWCR